VERIIIKKERKRKKRKGRKGRKEKFSFVGPNEKSAQKDTLPW
jgi:hypothetical protein